MKKFVSLFLAAVMALSMVACGNSGEEANEPETVGEVLLADFKANAEGNAQEIVDGIMQNEILPFETAKMPVEPGLLTGFDNAEITGFKEGVMFAPMMGTIPFVGYVVTLEDGADVSAFISTLTANANKRWNICTEAEETVTGSKGNKVFFVMCNKSIEE